MITIAITRSPKTLRSDLIDSAAAEKESRLSSNADDEFDVKNNVISSESTPEAENRCFIVIVDDPGQVSDAELSVSGDEVKAGTYIIFYLIITRFNWTR